MFRLPQLVVLLITLFIGYAQAAEWHDVDYGNGSGKYMLRIYGANYASFTFVCTTGGERWMEYRDGRQNPTDTQDGYYDYETRKTIDFYIDGRPRVTLGVVNDAKSKAQYDALMEALRTAHVVTILGWSTWPARFDLPGDGVQPVLPKACTP